jgi:hypothetical protein
MTNLARTLSLLSASFIALFAQSQNQTPELWAAIGVGQPLVFERPDYELNISFALVNDGNMDANTDFQSWKILINGHEVPDSHWIFGNGPGPTGRSGGWERLPVGGSFIFGKSLRLGEYFPKPGTYEVAWKGSRFSAKPAVVRVLPLEG